METAVRWSPGSTENNQRFLYVDVAGKSLRLCRVQAWNRDGVEFETISTHTKVPSFRAFDWSPSNEALVAVGQSSGEATVLRIDDGSQDQLSFQIRNQRLCNSVAFSTQNLLAAGLDKVRNDFCLNIWDLQQRLPPPGTRGLGKDKFTSDPLHKLASSEPITSIKFFLDNPQLLVAGVKGQFVRLYDLREPLAGGSLQFATRCVHNLAIDACDENYLASCYPVNDPTICIWDRRYRSRLNGGAAMYSSALHGDVGSPEASLELRNAVDNPGSIWSLRFSKTQRGCLGVLSSTGHFKTYKIGKEHPYELDHDQQQHSNPPGRTSTYPEKVYIAQTHDLARAYCHPSEGRDEKARVVSFDFTTLLGPADSPKILTLAGDGAIGITTIQSIPPPMASSSLGYFCRGERECQSSVPGKREGERDNLKVGNVLDQIRRKAEPRNALRIAAKHSKQIKADDPFRHASSSKNHEWNSDLGYFEQGIGLAELLTLTSTQRLRCEASYFFSATKNKSIVSDSPWLQAFWKWIERANKQAKSGNMVQDDLDVAYLGVHAIWMDDIGSPPHKRRVTGLSVPRVSKVIETLAQRLDIPVSKGCPTAYSDHRRLCLHISGLAWSHTELEAHVRRLVSQNQHTKAAAIAIFADERKLAYRALRHKSSTQNHKMLSMAIAGATERRLLSSAEDTESEDDWSESIATLADELTDPYARAILAFVRSGSYEAVVEETSLPLKDRVGVALRWLSDRKLTEYISKATRDAVASGDVEGVILTGIGTSMAVDLLGNYVRKFGDLQTAVLALSHTVPRYVDDGPAVRRFSTWRDTYRYQMNSWGLKYDRVRFDIACQKLATDRSGRKLIEAAKPQVALVCGYCNQSLAQFENRADTDSHDNMKTHATPQHPLTSDKAAAIGTVCPKCGRHLPRCGVCDMWLGMPDPSHMRWYRQDKSASIDLGASMAGSVNTTLGPGTTTGAQRTSLPKVTSTGINGDQAYEASKDTQTESEMQKEREEMLQSGLGNVTDEVGTASALAFHEKIARLKPVDQDTKPNTFWVGILKHNKKPSDELVQADCLWVKCAKNKHVGRVREAYVSVENLNEKIILRHAYKTWGFKIIPDHTIVDSMNTRGDDVVVLEAIKISDLASRTLKEERPPLQDVTNTAAATKPVPVGVKPEPPEPRTPLPVTQTPRPAPASSTPSASFADAEWAWIDFNCERREVLQRVRPRVTPKDIKEMDDQVLAEWLQLEDGQTKFFETRARRIAVKLAGFGSTNIQRFAATSQGFWWYYYTSFYADKAMGNDPHQSFESTQIFFNNILTRWLGMALGPQHDQIRKNLAFLERNPIPPMPQRLAEKLVRPVVVKPEAGSSPKDESPFGKSARSISPSQESDLDSHSAPSRSPSPAIADDQPTSTRLNIPDLFVGCTPEQLEKGVERGVAILDRLKLALSPKEGDEAAEAGQWLQSIDNVRKQAVRTRTVIGVVGNTGAGKSSVINALMDEERLLPTNCMRACTAVITEISYNYENAAYSAEIEFITADDWRLELEILFKDLLDGNGNVSRECANEDSEAGIAYAKIKAVYPKLTKDDISNSSVVELMRYNNVSRLLGSSISIEERDSLVFYKKLQSYVDSKEKTTKSDRDKSDKEKKKPREMEFWPLIKVVRLYVKAPALSTGAVIVDLPGVHDSNQARAAVAQNYMKQCTGLWICAPINRAVDDKAAKSLLGETFKRQLKMDGGYSTVTFICSKTDDISLMEAQDSLGIEEELSELWDQCDKLSDKKKSLKRELEALKETKGDFSRAMEAADEQLDVWEKLKDDIEDGKTVYPPRDNQKMNEKKRKRGRPKKSSVKKPHLNDSDDDFIDDSPHSDRSNESDSDSEAESEHQQQGEPLTEACILEKISELRATKKDGRQQRAQLDNEIKNLRGQIQDAENEYDAVEAIISSKCIQGRNEYSKGAIQQDFAAGIKELDMEIQEEEDAANFNPEADARDYDEIARSLPVFTVSSRAYQKLKGRLAKDKDVPGFATVYETQIPQLQEHARKTTEAGRQANCKRFLNSMSQLLNSLRLWASSDGTSSNLTELQKSQEARILQDRLSKLDGDLEKEIRSLCKSLMSELQDNVLDQFSAAVQHAISEACNTAGRWGAPVNRDNRTSGGLYWATYKALCRRDGLFSNAQGLHDWNAQLTEPIIKKIASGWERTFSRRMPSVLNGLAIKSGELLTAFHKNVESRAMRNGTSLASLEMLKQQLPSYKDTMKYLSAAAQTQIAARQKDINREFVPVVAEAMKQVYDDCENESGPGQYARMKAMMTRHVEGVRDQMFNDSANAVKLSLKKLVKDIEDFLLGKADEVFISVKRDYESVVLGRHAAAQQLPREKRQIRSEVTSIVEDAELVFKKAVGLEPETPEASAEDLEEEDIPTTTELVEEDVVVKGSEAVEDTKADTATGAVLPDETDHGEGAVVEPSPAATMQEEAKISQPPSDRPTPPTPSHNHTTQIMEEIPQSPDSPLRVDQADLMVEETEPLCEASSWLIIPPQDKTGPAPCDDAGKENEGPGDSPTSVSERDQGADGEAAKNSPRYKRSSSAASWVQSWFSPRV